MTNAELATIATKIFFKQLRYRVGFGELMDSIPEWRAIEQAMRENLEEELDRQQPAPKNEEFDFLK